MIGLDTNLLVRYLAQDDPVQSPKATEVIERQLTEENPGFISIVALVETVWVLEHAYRLTSIEIATVLERLLQTEVLLLQNETEVFTAAAAVKEGRGAFADAIIAELGTSANCSYTLTFDGKALRLPAFKLL